MLRPIHVIQSGLTRLGRGELDVALDLPGEEFRDLGSSFDAISAQLVRGRAPEELPASATDFESVMDNLEDAVALFSPEGELMFANSVDARRCCRRSASADHAAMRCSPADNPYDSWSSGRWPAAHRRARCRSRWAHASRWRAGRAAADVHAIEDTSGRFPRRDAGRAEPRLPEPCALDAQLFAQARGARAG